MSEYTRDEVQKRNEQAIVGSGCLQAELQQAEPLEFEDTTHDASTRASIMPVAFRQQGLRALPGFLKYLFQQYLANRGTLNAAALTCTTLFAVVPLMTVSYAILSSVPSFGDMSIQLESLIFDHFVPSSGLAVRGYLSQFATQARTLTAVGIVVLVITAYMMLKTIESAFNRIWRVQQARKGISSFLLYWAVLSLGPVLLGMGFALSSYVASLPLITGAAQAVNQAWLLKMVVLLTSMSAFTLIYAAVPNCYVPLRHAAIGGLVVALVFEAARQMFTLFVTHFPSYELIYGAFAAVPLFLAWIYISWMIILLGAELVRAIGHYQSESADSEPMRLNWTLMILQQLWQAQQQGASLSQRYLVTHLPYLSLNNSDQILKELEQLRLVQQTDGGRYILSRDLNLYTLSHLCEGLPWKTPAMLDMQVLSHEERPRWQEELNERLQELQQARKQALDISLAELFQVTHVVDAKQTAATVAEQQPDEAEQPGSGVQPRSRA